jgi:hypothetical protein
MKLWIVSEGFDNCVCSQSLVVRHDTGKKDDTDSGVRWRKRGFGWVVCPVGKLGSDREASQCNAAKAAASLRKGAKNRASPDHGRMSWRGNVVSWPQSNYYKTEKAKNNRTKEKDNCEESGLGRIFKGNTTSFSRGGRYPPFEPGSKSIYRPVFVSSGLHTMRISDEEVTYIWEFLKVKEPFDHNSLKDEPLKKQFSIL